MAKTPVTILHEYMTQRGEQHKYDLLHNQILPETLFKYKVSGLGKMAIGSGKSKREAKHEAARRLLQMLKDDEEKSEVEESHLLKEVDDCFSPYDNTVKENAVGDLLTFCSVNGLMNPEYDLTSDVGPPHSKRFTIRCSVSSLKFDATARTKKQAKHRSSTGMIDLLKVFLSDFLDSSENNNGVNNNVSETVVCDLFKRTVCFQYSFKDFINIFSFPQFSESKSPKLEDIRASYDKSEVIPDPLDSLKVVCEELNYDLDITKLPCLQANTVIVNIFLISKPGWSFIGCGQDYNDAVSCATLKVFEFLLDMVPKP